MPEPEKPASIGSKQTAARNATKWLADAIICIKVTDVAEGVITDKTRFHEGDLVTKLASQAIGGAVSASLYPITNKIVDVSFDYASAKFTGFKAKRALKKAAKKETTED